MVVALATALREKITDFVALWSLPEALYIVLLVWLGLVGAGRISVDHFVRSRQRRKEEPVSGRLRKSSSYVRVPREHDCGSTSAIALRWSRDKHNRPKSGWRATMIFGSGA